jgi:hypothetical protein
MKTAVEFLEKEIFRNYKFLLQKVDCTRLEESIKQAKEMEKEQIIDAYNQGCLDTLKDGMKRGEQYYNETFKNK